MTKSTVLPLLMTLDPQQISLAPSDLAYHYDSEKQINVLTRTGKPAVENVALGTRTVTDTIEATDEDPTDPVTFSLGTVTMTKVSAEGTDTDDDFSMIHANFGTKTLTFVEAEPTDSDDDQ